MPPLQPFEPAFEREQGSTEADWLRCLPGAVRDHALQLSAGSAIVTLGSGQLQLDWTVLPMRQIALMRMPRMAVRYRFTGVDADARSRFMQYFDLYMQRGGG